MLFRSSSSGETVAGSTQPSWTQDEDPKVVYSKKREDAGKDPVKLWELHLWCDAYGLEKEAKSCARAVVKYDVEHKAAHEFLGHVFYEGNGFTTRRKVGKHQAAEDKRMDNE